MHPRAEEFWSRGNQERCVSSNNVAFQSIHRAAVLPALMLLEECTKYLLKSTLPSYNIGFGVTYDVELLMMIQVTRRLGNIEIELYEYVFYKNQSRIFQVTQSRQ